MGKKNESKYDKLTYTGKLAADKRMAEQYGIDLSQYGNTERPGASYSGKKEWDELSGDVARAAANDYDVRRSIEAAQLSGNKKAQKVGSISNASEAYAATRFMEKTHKNRMGNGGAYDGANDQGNVTDYWVNKDRDKLMKSFSAQEVPNNDDEQTDTALTPEEPYEPSEELVKARAVAKEWEEGYGFGGNKSWINDYSGDADSTETAFTSSSNPVTTDVNSFAANLASRKNNKAGANDFATDFRNNVIQTMVPKLF